MSDDKPLESWIVSRDQIFADMHRLLKVMQDGRPPAAIAAILPFEGPPIEPDTGWIDGDYI